MSPTKRKSSDPLVGTEHKKNRIDQTIAECDLWVDKYRPTSTKQVIGQQGDKSCVNKLVKWLSNWHQNIDKKPGFGRFASDDGSGFRAALLSGQPGVGKTTSAHLVCKELGFDFIELNASDARNKRTLDEVVKELIQNTTLSSYFGAKRSEKSVTSKHVVIMDEVDGMAGNEDRGGIAELIQLIKTTKVPIICICNDRSHPKMRSLVNYCFDLRFFRPRVEQIKGPMMSIAYKEGIQIAPNVLHELIVSSNQDIRQVLHNLSLLSTGHKKINNLISDHQIKDVKLGPFDAVRKVFTAGEEYAKMSFQDKSDLFFTDYSLMPLMNFENYLLVNPNGAKSESNKLKLAMKSIEGMCFGDIIEKQIRTSNNWSLLPLEAAFASVMPGAYMSGQLGSQINFPAFMGKLSTTNKQNRLLQDLKMHMNWRISGSKTALNLDYLQPLRDSIIEPLVMNGSSGVPIAIEKLKHYSLRREDIDAINELTLWKHQNDPMSRIDSKVKSALTRAYNKEMFCLPYSLESTSKAKKSKSSTELDELDLEHNEDEAITTIGNEESDDDIESDAMIKKKTVKKGKQKDGKQSSKEKNENQKQIKNKNTKKVQKESNDKQIESNSQKDVKKQKQKRIVIESDDSDEEIVKPIKDNRIKGENIGLNDQQEETKPVRRSPRKTTKEDSMANNANKEKTPIKKKSNKNQNQSDEDNDVSKTKAKNKTPKDKKVTEAKPSKVSSSSKSPQSSLLGWLKKC